MFCPVDPPLSVPGLVWAIWSFYCGPGHVFSEFFGPGLGWFLRFFVLPIPPAQCRAMVWVTGAPYRGLGLYVSRVRFFFVLPTPPPRGRGRSG